MNIIVVLSKFNFKLCNLQMFSEILLNYAKLTYISLTDSTSNFENSLERLPESEPLEKH